MIIALLVVSLFASFAQGGKVVIVLSSDAGPYTEAQTALEKSLSQKGHNVTTVKLVDISEKFDAVSKGVNAFVAVGTKAAVWLHGRVVAPQMLVYCMVASPASNGLDAGEPTSGISTDVPIKKQFELIAEAMPSVKVVGMLYRSDNPRSQATLVATQEVLPKDWKLEAVAVDKHSSVADAIEELFSRNIDIVWTSPDSAIFDVATARTLLLTSVRRSKPVFGFSPAFVRAGALLGIGIEPGMQGEQAAELCDRLLKDAAAASGATTQHIQEEPKFQVAVNLIVAKKMSVEISDDFVNRAAQVIRKEGENK